MTQRHRLLLLATTALMPLSAGSALANPLGGQVVGGSATIAGQGTATVTVTQTSQSAAINWNTFNIGAGQTTQFIQPNANAVVLDRITGGQGPSQIFGNLISNGIVFLVNPNGILFGRGSQVNVGGLLATTHDINTGDFMAGRYNFNISGNPNASVVNQGNITAASGGFAALVAPGVRNSGTITATLGTVGLAAGNSFTLDLYGDNLINLAPGDAIARQVVDVATGKPLTSLITNTGKISANGGRVQITAAAAKAVVNSVINNKGVIEANSIGQRNGMIVLSAATAKSKPAGAPAQTVKISGKLQASGTQTGTTGGTIQITGENIALTGAMIDASGKAGGGTVLIGGDTGGGAGNPAVAGIPQAALQPYLVPTAATVSVDAASTITASATTSGNGGKVVVWSDQLTTVAGLIKATGGAQGGNGGFVETSSHGVLSYTATVDVSATAGNFGTLLLDPYDVTISAAPNAGGSLASGAFTPSANDSVLNVTTLTNALATTNVVVTTGTGGTQAGNITVAAPVTWSSGGSLTLSAFNNVIVNASIANTGGAAVTLRADSTGTGNGTVSFGAGGNVSTAGPVSIFYNPSVNPAGRGVNTTSYVNPIENYAGNVSGGGTLTAYMLVNSVYDLQNVQNNLGGTYALGRNIDAGATAGWNGGGGFVPIGSGTTPFTGTFNGQSDTIDNLTISRPTTTPAGDYTGLFASVGANGIVENVGLLGGSVTGEYSVGSLVGQNAGTVTQSYATGTVTAARSSGGLIGQNSGTVTSAHASGAVNGQSELGGLIGRNSGSVLNSYATGAINGQSELGGLIGYNSGSVSNSYATGVVNGQSGSTDVGGLIGTNSGSVTLSYATGAVSNGSDSGNTGDIIIYNNMGGLVGSNSGTVSQSYALGTVTGASNSNGVGGLVGSNSGGIIGAYAMGTINGGIGSNNVGGLVGYSGPGNTSNLNVSVTQSYATGAVTGSTSVGGLIGTNAGIVSQSYATGSATGSAFVGGLIGANVDTGTVSQSYATGNVSGATSVGGLVGYAGPGSGLTGNVSITQSYAIGAVNGTTNVGGLVGDLESNGIVAQTYATGRVTGGSSDSTGGLIGYSAGNVSSSFWDTVTTGQVNGIGTNIGIGAATGLSTSQFATTSNFNGFSFGTSPNASGCNAGTSACWVLIDTDGSLNNAGGAAGATRPMLLSEYSTNIANPHQLQLISLAPSANYTLANSIALGAALANPADVFGPGIASGPTASFIPIGAGSAGFTGTLNGRGFTLDGLAIASSAPWLGLFATIGDGGVVTNLNLTNVDISGTSGNAQRIGAVAGSNAGTIRSVTVSGTLSALSGNSYVGGIAGTNSGAITKSSANVTATADNGDETIRNHDNTPSYVGGLVGYNTGTIDSSQTSGAISNGSAGVTGGLAGYNSGVVSNSQSTASVSAYPQSGSGDNNGSSSFGGLVGKNDLGGRIISSAASGNVNGGAVANYVGGLVGWNSGMVSEAYATGSVAGGYNIGGLTGYNNGNVTQTYAAGIVTAQTEGSNVGGLVGWNDLGGNITSSFWDTTATGTMQGAGKNSGNFSATGLDTAHMQDLSSFQTTYTGWDFQNVWAPPNQAGQGSQTAAYYPQLYALSPVVWNAANNATSTYGGPIPTLTAAQFGGPSVYAFGPSGDKLNIRPSLSTPATPASNTGTYAVVNQTPGSATSTDGVHYRVINTGGMLTITPATLTYLANAATRTYGAANPALSGTVTGFVNGDTAATATTGTLGFATAATSASNVGTYAIAGSGLTANYGNYVFTQASGNATAFTVTPATLTYVANAATRTYGATNPALSGTVTEFVNGDTAATATTGTLGFATAATSASNVGTYAIAGSGLTANYGNYVFTQASGNATAFTITPATLTYVANAATRTYGAANPALSGTVTGFVNGDTAATATTGTLGFATAATSASNVGTYAIAGSGLTANYGNYVFTQASGNATAFTITPATLTYVANAATRTYGAANPALSGTVTGFVNGDTVVNATTGTLAFATAATPASNVGTYAIAGSGLTANYGNYVFTQASGNATAFTVTPATLTYVANDIAIPAGAPIPTLGGTVSGFVNGDTLVTATTGTLGFATTTTSSANPGSYPIFGSGLTANHNNYTFVQASGNAVALTITPPQLTARNYGIQQISNLVQPALFPGEPNGAPVVTSIDLGPGGSTGGVGNRRAGNGRARDNRGSANPANGNSAPGTRLIDMPVIPLPPGSGMPPPGETRFSPTEVVLQFGAGVTAQQIAEIGQRFGLTVVATQQISMLGRSVYTFDIGGGRTVRQVIALIEAAHIPVAVQPNYTYGLTQAPAALPDPAAALGDSVQYVVGKLQLPQAHRLNQGDNVIVAVIDSAIDANHPDIAGTVTSQIDAGCGNAAADLHGTGMAGAIAAHRALVGIAPNVKIIAICAFGGTGAASQSNSIKIMRALDTAVAQGARVINMSFAGPRDPALAQAIQIAFEKRIVLVAAAGNAGPRSPPLYPGADPHVIAVTATDQNDRLFSGANQGKYIAVAAPGVDILVPAPDDRAQLTTGTSVAAAEVSGVAALLIAQNPRRTPTEIRTILMSTAKDLGPKGFDPQFGAGLVDPLRALQYMPRVSLGAEPPRALAEVR